MKTSRVLGLVATALIVGFMASRWGFAQPAQQPSENKSTTDSFIGVHELESFVTYLQDTKQTNTLKRFNDYLNVTIASQHYAELGGRLRILEHIRNGRTNEAIRML